MITDAKVVKSVNSNAPKKGWKIEWVDGKFDNIFDEGWLPLLDESIRTNRLVSFDKEKNEAGYWNIKKLELATLPEPEEKSEIVKEAVKQGSVVTGDTNDTRIRSMCLSYSKDLVVGGIVELKDILKTSDKFIKYILNIKDE